MEASSFKRCPRPAARPLNRLSIIVANTLNIGVDVFKDQVPHGYRVQDMGGAGDCLIHSLIGASTHLESGKARRANEAEIMYPRNTIVDERRASLRLLS